MIEIASESFMDFRPLLYNAKNEYAKYEWILHADCEHREADGTMHQLRLFTNYRIIYCNRYRPRESPWAPSRVVNYQKYGTVDNIDVTGYAQGTGENPIAWYRVVIDTSLGSYRLDTIHKERINAMLCELMIT